MSTIDELIEKALYYIDTEKNIQLALKYGYMAASLTYTPRADVCCVIGEAYMMICNYEWAKKWYKSAISNNSCGFDEVVPDQEYFTTIPLIKLGAIEHAVGNDAEALELYNSVLKFDPDNEIALENVKIISENKKETV